MLFLTLTVSPFRAACIFAASLLFLPQSGWSTGVLPEVPVVIINAAQQGGSINVKNTDPVPVLLYTRLVTLPDDPQPGLFVTQPVVRLAAGQTQKVRFLYSPNGKLTTEHFSRVFFETIPEKKETDRNTLSLSVSQDLPVVIVPEDLMNTQEMPWEKARWTVNQGTLRITNGGRQVMRLQPRITLFPQKQAVTLGRNYILPGETLQVPLSEKMRAASSVQFAPVTRYGFSVPVQTALLNVKAK